jgi:hypothetical protein
MRALLALTLLTLTGPLPAQAADPPLRLPLAPGQLWVHQGRLRAQTLGQDDHFHVTQLTCIARPLSGERFRLGGMIDVRSATFADEGNEPIRALFTGVAHVRDGISEFSLRSLSGEVPLAWNPQAAFPPMPVPEVGPDVEPHTRVVSLWWGETMHRGRVRIAEEGEVRLEGIPCALWHMNHQVQRGAGPEGHRHAHTRISLWWDAATAMPARVQTYLLGSTPGRPLFQETLTLDLRRLVETSDSAAIAAFERLSEDAPPDSAVFGELAEHITDPETKRLVQALAEALR